VGGEYCVLVRRDALLETPYNEKPGRDNTLVTWALIARRHGAAAYDRPVLRYDDAGEDRLSSRQQALADPLDAAWCHHQILDLFGEDMRELAPDVWADHLARAAFFSVLGGQRRDAARDVRRALSASRSRSVLAAAAAVAAGPALVRRLYRG
jgi:hypothetical protein